MKALSIFLFSCVMVFGLSSAYASVVPGCDSFVLTIKNTSQLTLNYTVTSSHESTKVNGNEISSGYSSYITDSATQYLTFTPKSVYDIIVNIKFSLGKNSPQFGLYLKQDWCVDTPNVTCTIEKITSGTAAASGTVKCSQGSAHEGLPGTGTLTISSPNIPL